MITKLLEEMIAEERSDIGECDDDDGCNKWWLEGRIEFAEDFRTRLTKLVEEKIDGVIEEAKRATLSEEDIFEARIETLEGLMEDSE